MKDKKYTDVSASQSGTEQINQHAYDCLAEGPRYSTQFEYREFGALLQDCKGLVPPLSHFSYQLEVYRSFWHFGCSVKTVCITGQPQNSL